MRTTKHTWMGFLAVLTAIIGGSIWAAPEALAAEAGGYPYAGKPCVHAPYQASGSAPQWCPGYDWGDRPNDTSSANVISPYGYYYRNCTDYVAWRLAGLGIAPAQYKGLGNAKEWGRPPAAHGLRVDATPAAGAAAVRTTGVYGHVAYVEVVHADGTITVAQYNKQATGVFSVESGTPAALGFSLFVHFELFAAPPEPAPVVLSPQEPVPIAPVEAVQPVPPASAPEPTSTTPVLDTPPVQPEPATVSEAAIRPVPDASVTPQVPQVAAVRHGSDAEPVISPEAAASQHHEEQPEHDQAALPSPQTIVPPPAASPPAPQPAAVLSSVSIAGVPELAQPLPPVTPAVLRHSLAAIPSLWWQQARRSPPAITSTPDPSVLYWPLIGLLLLVVMREWANGRAAWRWPPVKMLTVRI